MFTPELAQTRTPICFALLSVVVLDIRTIDLYPSLLHLRTLVKCTVARLATIHGAVVFVYEPTVTYTTDHPRLPWNHPSTIVATRHTRITTSRRPPSALQPSRRLCIGVSVIPSAVQVRSGGYK